MSRLSNPKRLTKDQLQQHKRTAQQLQKANAIAAQGLIKLDRLRTDQGQYEHVYTDLAGVVRCMNFLIGCCQQIVAKAFQQRLTRIEIVYTLTCEHCEANPRPRNRSSGQGDLARTLEDDPAWRIQVESLLRLTTSTIDRTFRRAWSSPTELKKALRCLADLTKVLLREQRHLERMGSGREPEIAVIYDDDEVCSECGQRKTGGPLMNDDDDDVSSPGIP